MNELVLEKNKKLHENVLSKANVKLNEVKRFFNYEFLRVVEYQRTSEKEYSKLKNINWGNYRENN